MHLNRSLSVSDSGQANDRIYLLTKIIALLGFYIAMERQKKNASL